MKTLMTLALVLITSAVQAEGTHSGDHADMAMNTGTITRIDTKWNKLTIDHGPLESLDMPAMKMVFELADPALIEGLSEGQEVRFAADRVEGKLTVTEIDTE